MTDLQWCIQYLEKRHPRHNVNPYLPEAAYFRGLMNITMPYDLSEEYYSRQDDVLQDFLAHRKIIDVSALDEGISLHWGDITLMKADAIVNAGNSQLLGCFIPNHPCIDNAIHSFAGLQVRRDLLEVMEVQRHDEPNGLCKVTSAYNLPSKYIFHTVGPVYTGTRQDEIDLYNCYLSCLKTATLLDLESIVFCSISTGFYRFPIQKACKIAIGCVKTYLENEYTSISRVVFDLFSENDYDIYEKELMQEEW